MDRLPSTDYGSESGSLGVAQAVYDDIQAEGFDSSAVDALLFMVQSGGNHDMLGDVLAHLTNNKHPDWAAELCRMVMAGPGGSVRHAEHKDYATVSSAISHMLTATSPQVARELCTYIMEMKDDGQGNSYFDCTDLSQVLGHMVKEGNVAGAGQLLWDMYCDQSTQGRVYQVLVPYVLGSLVDGGQMDWAVELAKQLMYDGDRLDYEPIGWVLMQMVAVGRSDWAAAVCGSLRDTRARGYNQSDMFRAVAAWGGPAYPQAISHFLDYAAPNGNGNHYGYGQQQQHYQGGQQLASAMQRMNLGGQQQQQQGGRHRNNQWVRQPPQQQQQQQRQERQSSNGSATGAAAAAATSPSAAAAPTTPAARGDSPAGPASPSPAAAAATPAATAGTPASPAASGKGLVAEAPAFVPSVAAAPPATCATATPASS